MFPRALIPMDVTLLYFDKSIILFQNMKKGENMDGKIIYGLKGVVRALGEGFCFYVLLPIWYMLIKI